MGEVYRARDQLLDREVALKVLAVEADATRLAASLRREALILARLEHPGIVPVHDAGTLTDGRAFYVMRLVRGERLDQVARRATTLGELLRIFLPLCDAVGFAHARGVIHRDLKPGNVMVGPFGEVLVLDWGIAKAGWADEEGAVLGTPGFMAPEQAGNAEQADQRADVFGLGAILRELLVAAPGPARRPLQAIVSRATAARPEDRYATTVALAEDVRRWLDGEAVSAYQETVLDKAGRFYRRYQGAILLVLAYLVMRAVILLWRGV
jgi:serine/threonine protein kinase